MYIYIYMRVFIYIYTYIYIRFFFLLRGLLLALLIFGYEECRFECEECRVDIRSVVLFAHLPGCYGVEHPVGVRRLTYLHPSTPPNTHMLTFMNTHILTSIHTMLAYLHLLTYLHFHPTHMYIHAHTHAHTQTHTHTHTTSLSLFVSHTLFLAHSSCLSVL